MFKALGKFVGLLDQKDDSEVEDQDEEAVTDVRQITEQEISGTVSSLHSDYGIINSEIFFSFDVVQGAENRPDGLPKVGETVLVHAERTGISGGWRATRVVVNAENWDLENDDDREERTTVVGVVSDVDRQGRGVVNRSVHFDRPALGDYYPYVGDWVSVECTTLHNYTTATSVRPLRSREFTGDVNAVRDWFGFVNGDIYFRTNVCEGFSPNRGDHVRGIAIESSQKKCTWRVLRMELTKNDLKPITAVRPSMPSFWQCTRDLESDKEGITVSHSDFGTLMMEQEQNLMVLVRNCGDVRQTLHECSLRAAAGSQFRVDSFGRRDESRPDEDSPPRREELPLVVEPGTTAAIRITCVARNLGKERQLLLMDFGRFKIGRFLTVNVTDDNVLDLDPCRPYQMRERRERPLADMGGTESYLPGQRPGIMKRSVQLPVKLGQYSVPEQLRLCMWEGQDPAPLVPVIKEELTMTNYASKFSALLYLEEIQMELDIRDYDMDRVCLRRFGEYLALRVPGLAEGRPSVQVGDKIVLSVPGEEEGPHYEGYVHELMAEEVLLKFHESFHNEFGGEDYNVMFSFSRTPMRRCHQVVNFARRLGDKILFPEKLEMRPASFTPKMSQRTEGKTVSPSVSFSTPRATNGPVPTSENSQNTPQTPTQRYAPTPRARRPDMDFDPIKFSPKASLNPRAGNTSFSGNTRGFVTPVRSPMQRAVWKTPTIEHEFVNTILNERQRSAVMRILAGRCRPSPYILFGPPGTGKTVTVVEAILQVAQHVTSSRILACAPSNSAADLLAERLINSKKIVPGQLVRLNAFRRVEESIPDILKPYCSDGEDLALAARHRIVIATCTTAASLFSLGLGDGHFTHAFIDEAGQATEPECIATVNLVAPEGLCILAGDPMQLGPVLRSNHAKTHGLQLSYLERLMARKPYLRNPDKFSGHGAYDPMLVTKLVKNYRSHPSLLSLPSELFYHSELEVCAATEQRECMCRWGALPTPGVPIVFHGIRGENMREGDSPSWFNAAEAVQVMKYLQSLVNNEVRQVDYDDIGIITPYRKQVEKIRLLIDRLGMEKVKVGSVEEFQGQERLVMILSLVRSDSRLLSYDQKYNLGFLTNPKRFNVAITRPQALMIVVGNPYVLVQDFFWRKLLEYCVQLGAYVGCDLPDEMTTSNVSTPENGIDEKPEKESQLEEKTIETTKTAAPSSDFESHSSDSVSTATVADSGFQSDNQENIVTSISERGLASPRPNLSKSVLNPCSPEFKPRESGDWSDKLVGELSEKSLADVMVFKSVSRELDCVGDAYGGARPKYSQLGANRASGSLGNSEMGDSRSSTPYTEQGGTDNRFNEYHGGYHDDSTNESDSRIVRDDSSRYDRSSLDGGRSHGNEEYLARRHSEKWRRERLRDEESRLNVTNRGRMPGSYPGSVTRNEHRPDSCPNDFSRTDMTSERFDQSQDKRRRRPQPNLPPRLRKKYENDARPDIDSDRSDVSDSRPLIGQSKSRDSQNQFTRTFHNSDYQRINQQSCDTTARVQSKTDSRTSFSATSGVEIEHHRSKSEPQQSKLEPQTSGNEQSSKYKRPSRYSEAQLSEAHEFLLQQQRVKRVDTLDLNPQTKSSTDSPPRLFPSPISSPRCSSDLSVKESRSSPISDSGRGSPNFSMTGVQVKKPLLKAMIGRGRASPIVGEYYDTVPRPPGGTRSGSSAGVESERQVRPEGGAPTSTTTAEVENDSRLEPRNDHSRSNTSRNGADSGPRVPNYDSRGAPNYDPRGAPKFVRQAAAPAQFTGEDSEHDSDIIVESSGEET